ncbi:MAG: HAD family hydrolase [Candidatus Limnocylindria bacterium]
MVLFDVDNTLLDNDRLKADLAASLAYDLGAGPAADFARLYEQVRIDEDGVVDYPETLRRFAARHPALAHRANALINGVAFDAYVYPGALRVIADCRATGRPVVLSDGDPIYQVAKIERSGIAAAVAGDVLVFDHKERHVDEVIGRFPASRYLMVEDKAPTLALMKAQLGERLVTVHVRQGHYATEETAGFVPDFSIASVGDLAPARMMAGELG